VVENVRLKAFGRHGRPIRRRKEEQIKANEQRRFYSEKNEDFSAEHLREHLGRSLRLNRATVDRMYGAFCAQLTGAGRR
jgi:hypothetical protein